MGGCDGKTCSTSFVLQFCDCGAWQAPVKIDIVCR